MRVRESQGDLLRAGDILGGLMPWEGGYEAAWWVWRKKSKLTQTWYWFRGNWAWVRTSVINLDPYWILDIQSSQICVFLPRTWLYPFQVSGVVEAKSNLLRSFLHANTPTWYWTIPVGTYIYHIFWILDSNLSGSFPRCNYSYFLQKHYPEHWMCVDYENFYVWY